MNARANAGFSLIEVMVSLAILAAAIIPLMAVLGRASEDAYETVVQRKMRYLSQWVVGDLEVGKLSPGDPDEELPYEEGTRRFFADMQLSEDPDEFGGFFFEIEAFRDEIITGAPDEETALEAGFIPSESGGYSRAITSDTLSSQTESGGEGGLFGGLGGEGGGPPPGQIKRLAVISVRLEGETAEQDRIFRIMLYLPHPDEEQQSVEGGSEGAGGAGATPAPAAGGAGGTPDTGGGQR